MGGYPAIRTLPLRSRQRQYRDYMDAVVDRDVADVMQVRKPDALWFLIDQRAARTAQEINTSELAKLAKLKRETVDQYLDILIDGGHRMVAIEVRSAATVAGDDFKHLRWFANDGPGGRRQTVCLVFYLGQEKLTMGDGCFALPLSALRAAEDLD